VGLSHEESSMLFVLAWGLICFGVFKIFGPVALSVISFTPPQKVNRLVSMFPGHGGGRRK
jgi:hypothetical protein